MALFLVAGCFEPAQVDGASGSTGGEGATQDAGPTSAGTMLPATSEATGSTEGSTTDEPTGSMSGPTSDSTSGSTSSSDSTSEATSQSGSSSGSTGNEMGDECGVGGTCFAAPPAGWNGPVAVALEDVGGDDEAACGGAYPVVSTEAFGDLQFEAADCPCVCGDASGASCTASATLHRTMAFASNPPVCASGSEIETWDFPIPSTVSFSSPVTSTSGWFSSSVNAVGPSGGSCTPFGAVDAEPAAFASRVLGCASENLVQEDCVDGDVCAPALAAPFEAMCIWAEGDLPCPDGTFSDRTMYHRSFVDSRDCEECTCAAAEGTCQEPALFLVSNSSVSGETFTSVEEGAAQCAALDPNDLSGGDAFVGARLLTPAVESASCAPNVPQPSGDVQASDAVTMCCAS